MPPNLPPSLLILVSDILKPDEPPLRYHFSAATELTIGRASDCAISLDSLTVSKWHARLLQQGGELLIIDLESTNGVYVDGERLHSSRRLRGGEEIYIGTFVLSIGTAERAPSDWGGRRTHGGHRPMRLYIGYAPQDACHREALTRHLASFQREGLVFAWHDQMATPGTARLAKQIEHLTKADAVVLLVSAYFLASEHCATVEMQRAFEQARAGKSCVLPVLVRPVTLRGTPLHGIQFLPRSGRPVSLWPDQDEAWVEIVAGIREGLQCLAHTKSHR